MSNGCTTQAVASEDRRPDKPPMAICLVGGDLGARPPVASAAGTYQPPFAARLGRVAEVGNQPR
jgi:hypothetical protein